MRLGITCRLWAIGAVVSTLMVLSCGPVTQAQEIWLGPNQPPSPSDPRPVDWGQLFERDAPWTNAAANTRVFILEPTFIRNASDAVLSKVAADLLRRHIGIDVDIQSIAKIDDRHCGGIEGYAYPPEIRVTAEKLKRLNIPVAYIHIDEPIWFGSYSHDSRSCHLSILNLVERVAENITEFLKIYPDVSIVQVEPIPGLTSHQDWEADVTLFKHSLEATLGKAPTTLQLDINWNDPAWPEALRHVRAFTLATQLKLGLIYNGTGMDYSDTDWIANAVQNFDRVEDDLLIIPDQAIFASWDPFPTHLLPESDPLAQTYLIDRYLLPRTRIIVSQNAKGLYGRLLDGEGKGISGAQIEANWQGVDPSRPLPLRTVRGTVPFAARAAIIGIRLNVECNCVGPNDVMFGDILYHETQKGSASRSVSLVSKFLNTRAQDSLVRVAAFGKQAVAEIITRPDQNFLFNFERFAVTPGAEFLVTVPVGTRGGDGMFGNVTIIWLDENSDKGHGIGRTFVTDREDYYILESLVTGRDGRFSIARPLIINGATRRLRLFFRGTLNYRSASVEVR
jgi:hypothetical protein